MGWFAKVKSLILGSEVESYRQEALVKASVTTTSVGQSQREASASSAERATIDNKFFHLGDYFGVYARSRTGRWVLSWRDAEPSERVGGHRESDKGSYLLYDTETNQVVARGEMQRPNNGHVSDSGIFSLEDWHFGSTLSGTFSVFDHGGRKLFTKDVTANILHSAISESGIFALFQTANSRTEDGTKIFFIDVSQGKLLYSVTPAAGWPDRYEIKEKTGEAIAHFKGLGSFRYSRQGDLVDTAKLTKAKLDSSRYELAIPAAEQVLKSPNLTPEQAREALNSVLLAQKNGLDMVDSWKAQSFKVEGLAHEALGNFQAAVKAFDQAMALNPKIGVKRKRDSLAKKLG